MKRELEVLKQRLTLLKMKDEERKRAERQKWIRAQFEKQPSKRLLEKTTEKEKGKTEEGEGVLDIACVEGYWRSILCQRKPFDEANEYAEAWGNQMSETYGHLAQSESVEVSENEWDLVVKRTKPWKAPGPDGIQGFWWKIWRVARECLLRWTRQAVCGHQNLPSWFTRGRSVLLYKKGDPCNPANYRPITCLCVCYKIVTSLLTEKLQSHLSQGNAIPLEQRALKRGEWGCTHAHLLDTAIVSDTIKSGNTRKKLAVAWIDYAKAYDSIPHSLFLWCMRKTHVSNLLIHFIAKLMSRWSTTFSWKNGGKSQCTRPMRISNGLLQGDSLSPLAFCLCVAPVSFALNKEIPPVKTIDSGYSGPLELNHQFYMDDLKLYARSDSWLNSAIQLVSMVSKNLGLIVNTAKCARAYYRIQPTAMSESTVVGAMPLLGISSTYKYLGIQQAIGVDYPAAAKCVEQGFLKRVQMLFGTELSIGQKVRAYNSIAVPMVRYLYQNVCGGAGKFTSVLKAAKRLDVKVRKLMVLNKIRYKSSAVSNLYVSRPLGGAGFKSLEDVLYEVTLSNYAYLTAGTGTWLKKAYGVFEKLGKRGKRTPLEDMKMACVNLDMRLTLRVSRGANQVDTGDGCFDNHTDLAAHLVKKIQSTQLEKRIRTFEQLVRAGRVKRCADLNWVQSCAWIKKGCVSAEAERNARVVMEGNLTIAEGRMCRACKSVPETIPHIVSSCPHWVANLYEWRHNDVLRNIHYALCRKYGLKPPHFRHQLEPVLENDKVKILVDVPIQTLTPLAHNRPDLVIFDKVKKQITVVEVRVSWFTCIKEQINAKVYKYTIDSTKNGEPSPPNQAHDSPNGRVPHGAPNLIGDMMMQYKQPVLFIPIIIGVTGEVEKTLPGRLKDLEVPNVSDLLERMQRSAVLSTSRIIKRHMVLPIASE